MTKPTILDRLIAPFTATTASTRAAIRDQRATESRVSGGKIHRAAENLDVLQAQIDLMLDRFGDGFFPLGGAYPSKDSRRAGHNIPVVFNEPQLDQYRNISRLLYDTNDYFRGLLDRLVDYECGRGFQWTPYRLGEQPAGPSEETPRELLGAQAAIDRFKKRDRFRGRERELCRRGHRDGEAFLRMFRSLPGRPPSVRATEPERVATPKACPSENGPFSFGILTHPDDVEKALAYHVVNPNNSAADGEIVLAGGLLPEEEAEARELCEQYAPGLPIGAGRMYHYKCNVDRTIKRGMPTFAAAASGYDSATKLLRNIVDTAALQAAIYLIRKHIGGTSDSVKAYAADFANSGTVATVGLSKSSGGPTIRNVPAAAQGGSVSIDSNDAVEYGPGPVSTGVPGFLEALQAQLRRGGCRVGAPEYLSSGDASNGNYASTKEAGSPFVVATEGRQQDLADFEEVLADDVLKMTVPVDGIGFVGVCVAVQPPAVSIRSELEVDQQREVQHRNNVLSAKTWQKAAGLKPEAEQANFKEERDLNPDMGAMLPLDGAGQSGATNGQPQESFNRLASAFAAIAEGKDDSGHQHKGKGPGGGQFTSNGDGGGGDGKKKVTPKDKSKPDAPASDASKPNAPTDKPQGDWNDKGLPAKVASIKQNREFLTKSLSTEEKAAIDSYTQEGFRDLNKTMRQCPPEFKCLNSEQRAMAGHLENAIGKMPEFTEPVLVHRGLAGLDGATVDGMLKAMNESKDGFSLPSLTSTSASSVDVKTYPPETGQMLFLIKARTGLYVDPVSSMPGEHEVIQSPKTRYKLSHVEKTSGGGHIVYLEETK